MTIVEIALLALPSCPEIATEKEKTSTEVTSSFTTYSSTRYLRPISLNPFFFLNFRIAQYGLLVHDIILTSSSFLLGSLCSKDQQMPKLGKSSHLRLTFTNLHLDLFTANTPSRLAKY
jgi:hypothetical protein